MLNRLHPPVLAALLLGGATAAQDGPASEQAPTLGLVRNEPGAFQGYTLFAPLRSTTTYLVDMEGEVVHRWESESQPGNSVYLLEDGSLLRCERVESEAFRGGGIGGRVRRLAPNGEVLWTLDWADGDKHHHHDIAPTPEGNVLLISWERIPAEEAARLGRDPGHTSPEGFWPDAVFEVRPTPPVGGEVVWEWHAADHLVQDHDERAAGYGEVPAHPGRIDVNADHREGAPLTEAERRRRAQLEEQMRALGYVGDEEDEESGAEAGEPERRPGDWLHTNGIDLHAGLDLIVLSVRTLNEVWILDHSTSTEEAAGSTGGRYGRGGDLLYRWGNPRTYGAGRTSDRRLFLQHDARFVGDAADLRLTVFNNGRERGDEPWSSVDEIVLPFDPERGFLRAEGEAFGPAEPAWSYTAPERRSFYSSFISGAQRLPNGNTLICSGAQGRLFEVTREGEVVWDYLNPFGGRPEGGGPPPGDRPPSDRPPGPPPGAGPPPAGTAPGRGGGGMPPTGLFRATRLAPDHPGIQVLLDAR